MHCRVQFRIGLMPAGRTEQRQVHNSMSLTAKIPGIVQSHAAKGQHIIGVDMSKLPLSDLHSDGTHPNDQGYTYMAGIWYAAIKDLLPK